MHLGSWTWGLSSSPSKAGRTAFSGSINLLTGISRSGQVSLERVLHSLILVPSYQGVIKESVRDRVVDSTCCPHAFGCRFAMNTKRKLGSAARVLTVLVRLKSAQTSPLFVLIYQRVYSKPKRPKHPSSGETISQSVMEAYLCLNGGGSFSHAFEDFGENVRPLSPRLRFLFVRSVPFC